MGEEDEVTGAGNRQELCGALDDAENEGLKNRHAEYLTTKTRGLTEIDSTLSWVHKFVHFAYASLKLTSSVWQSQYFPIICNGVAARERAHRTYRLKIHQEGQNTHKQRLGLIEDVFVIAPG
jgi:hypothetical protein